MSESWFLHCDDCDKDAEDVHERNTTVGIKALIDHAERIVTLSNDGFNGLWHWAIFGAIPVEFLAEHMGHKLRPKSEYETGANEP